MWLFICPHICILPTERQTGQPNKDDKPASCLEDRTVWKIELAAWAWVHTGLQLLTPDLV